MIELSPQQQQVVDHRGGDLQIIACAGSGKTESITRRIASLIVEGYEPSSIVAFTFTEKAAAELKERVIKRVEELIGGDALDKIGPMFIGTIHGYCFRLLQDYVPKYGNFDVLDDHRHAGLLSREFRNLGLQKLGSRHWAPIRDFIRNVDVVENELVDPKELAETELGDCYQAYKEMLDRFHFLTFGQIISRAVESLRDPEIFAKVHAPLRHLIVDEYQDVNPAQEELISLLSTEPVKLCVVGDDDQSIYQWRGADVSNILEFSERRKDVTTISLVTNRRSRPSIVKSASAFARTISPRLSKEMESSRDPSSVELFPWTTETAETEAETIANAIERLHHEGYQYRDIAVLFRSVRTSAPPLVEALRNRGIPFNCGGRTGLFMQPEISLFGEIYAWFADGEWKDERYGERRRADLDRIVTGLERYFANGSTIAGLRKYLEDGNAQAKWSQNTRAKESHFGLKNSVLLRCLSTELVAARSVQLFA